MRRAKEKRYDIILSRHVRGDVPFWSGNFLSTGPISAIEGPIGSAFHPLHAVYIPAGRLVCIGLQIVNSAEKKKGRG